MPFYYDKEIGASFHLKEVLENVLIFMPMGIHLQMLLPKSNYYKKLMIIGGTRLLLETAQYVLAIGVSDITDILTNTAGGLLGLILYSMIAHLLGKKEKTNILFSILGLIVSVIVVGMLGFILFANQ